MRASESVRPEPLRVVLWGTADLGKPRVRLLLQGLRANGVELIECHRDVWAGIPDKSQVRGVRRWLLLLGRVVVSYPPLAWKYLRLPRHDWVLLGYPAILDVFIVRGLAWLRGARVAMDWFLSAYDTVVLDRKLIGPRHPLAWVLRLAEWFAVRLPDLAFMDTGAHARRMEALFGLSRGRCGSVWVGAEDAFFAARQDGAVRRAGGAPLRVLFYGQLIPLHGIATIIEAARALRNEPIEWLLIGRGQESGRVRQLLEEDPLPRLRWVEWVEYTELIDHLRASDVSLGIFGTSEKAASVIPNKVFQSLGAGIVVITRDSPAIRELLPDGAWNELLVPPGDAAALATALLQWSKRPIRQAPDLDVDSFTARAVGAQLLHLLAVRTSSPEKT